jgi:hypothetical protein
MNPKSFFADPETVPAPVERKEIREITKELEEANNILSAEMCALIDALHPIMSDAIFKECDVNASAIPGISTDLGNLLSGIFTKTRLNISTIQAIKKAIQI